MRVTRKDILKKKKSGFLYKQFFYKDYMIKLKKNKKNEVKKKARTFASADFLYKDFVTNVFFVTLMKYVVCYLILFFYLYL